MIGTIVTGFILFFAVIYSVISFIIENISSSQRKKKYVSQDKFRRYSGYINTELGQPLTQKNGEYILEEKVEKWSLLIYRNGNMDVCFNENGKIKAKPIYKAIVGVDYSVWEQGFEIMRPSSLCDFRLDIGPFNNKIVQYFDGCIPMKVHTPVFFEVRYKIIRISDNAPVKSGVEYIEVRPNILYPENKNFYFNGRKD